MTLPAFKKTIYTDTVNILIVPYDYLRYYKTTDENVHIIGQTPAGYDIKSYFIERNKHFNAPLIKVINLLFCNPLFRSDELRSKYKTMNDDLLHTINNENSNYLLVGDPRPPFSFYREKDMTINIKVINGFLYLNNCPGECNPKSLTNITLIRDLSFLPPIAPICIMQIDIFEPIGSNCPERYKITYKNDGIFDFETKIISTDNTWNAYFMKEFGYLPDDVDENVISDLIDGQIDNIHILISDMTKEIDKLKSELCRIEADKIKSKKID